MTFSLSFCDITQISDNIFEVIDKEGVLIDKKCVDEVSKFWTELRQEPFGLLVNCQNSFSLSFEGACEIWIHPLQQNTAILVTNNKQDTAIKTVLAIKKALGVSYHHKVFYDRKSPIEWLRSLY